MARQPKRSAFVLTRIFQTLFKICLTIFLIITSVQSDNFYNNSTISEVINFNNNNSINNLPKFGDRILPRRQITSTNLTTIKSTIINAHSLNSVNKNLDNFSNINNININNNNSDHNLVTVDHHLINNKNDESYGDLVQNNNNRNISDVEIKQNDNYKNKQNHHMQSIVLTNAVIPVIDNQQDHQQLDRLELRRNDYNIDRDLDLVEDHINISKADRLIEMSTEFFIVPQLTSSQASIGINQRIHEQQRSSTSRPVLILASRTPPSNFSVTPPPSTITDGLPTGLRKEPWVWPVLVLALLAMIMMTAFEIFVLFKAWRTAPSRRHLFLGQMLLLGLFACAGLAALLTATSTVISCATIRFGVGVAYALVFATLLVKCVFLISLNSGVYLPAPYQGLLLLFAVLIQVAISSQWLMTQPPDIQIVQIPTGTLVNTKFSMLITSTDVIRQSTTIITLCKTQFSELLLSMIYIIFLIIFVAILAIKSRGIRDNYREATYIGLAIGSSIPIWLAWTLCGLAVADRHKDACLAFGLVATSATVFLVMFMPKGRQLAAMGKEGLYVEDREEQFSSLSRAGSGYSPSFFHFKPIKYGVMSAIPNSTTNTGNGNSTKHQSPATLGGGLFIRPDETNLYTTLEPTLSSNPNVYFQRSGGVHPGMMY